MGLYTVLKTMVLVLNRIKTTRYPQFYCVRRAVGMKDVQWVSCSHNTRNPKPISPDYCI